MIPIKNAKEIEKMRQACRTASDILHRVSDLVRPGVTTKEVDDAAADFMSEAHVKSAFLGYRLGHRVFPGNICISLNDEVVHGIGSQRRIQYGDIVKLDIGIIEDGWVRLCRLGSLMNGRISSCVSPKMRSRVQSALPVKAGASATSARKSRMKRAALVSQSFANLSGTEWGEKCTRNHRFRITANAAAARN
jgi:hypothetical protein